MPSASVRQSRLVPLLTPGPWGSESVARAEEVRTEVEQRMASVDVKLRELRGQTSQQQARLGRAPGAAFFIVFRCFSSSIRFRRTIYMR